MKYFSCFFLAKWQIRV